VNQTAVKTQNETGVSADPPLKAKGRAKTVKAVTQTELDADTLENQKKQSPKELGETNLKNEWEKAGNFQATEYDQSQATLPPHISVACAISLFLLTLRGQSLQTHKTYRVGCRVFMLFLHEKGLGNPTEIGVNSLPPLILEEYYLWLVDKYSRSKRTTVSGYMAGPRNLFSYLARREVSPNGVQLSKMTGGLSKLVGRSSYKTPRVDYSETRKLAEYMYNLKVTSVPNGVAAEDISTNEMKKSVIEADEQAVNGESGTEAEEAEKTAAQPTQDVYAAKRHLNVKELALRRLELLRDRAIILTLYTTGMRREEVSRLNRVDIRDGRTEEALITGKGDKERVVFFDEPTLVIIKEYLVARGDNYQPLFIQHRLGRGRPKAGGHNFRLSTFGIWNIVTKWAKVVGVTVRPHDFRHALATTMLNSGAQLSEVQDVLGHTSPVTTKMIYAHYERKTLRAAIDKHRVAVNKLTADS